MRKLKRREFLTTGMLAAGGLWATSRLALADTNLQGRSRLVIVIMRGALDGLAAVPPCADPDYARLRRELALRLPGSAGAALPLDGFFGLHPSLTFLHDSYNARELVVFHAIAGPYRDRSHFDGQDVLESGSLHAHDMQTGWLNRALVSLQPAPGSRELGVALGQNIPLIMRGPAAVTSWSPSRLAALDEDTLERLGDLYSSDPLLASRLADGLAANAMVGTPQPVSMQNGPQIASPEGIARAQPTRYAELVRATAGFLRREDGPRVAVFDTTGWDTHANEGSAEGQLAGRLAALDNGLLTLRDELGPVWNETAVLLVTEFGRTAAVNGTRGTDHGTATVAFLLGGAVRGGRVLTDWPGLAPAALYQGRDLRPTTDLRSLLKGVLGEHLRISAATLEGSVFPRSGDAPPLHGLFRA